MTITVLDNGVSVAVPAGWEAELFAVGDEPRSGAATARSLSCSCLHVANFSLPVERGHFGGGAVELMRRGDVLICVLEESPAMAGTTLYASEGLPQFAARDFDPNRMQRPIRGQSGAQAFFQLKGRPFVAYVVFGDHLSRSSMLGQVNAILGSLAIN